MRLFLLTSFTMIAFASNSLLTRVAVESGHIDAMSFAVLRVFAGAVFLYALIAREGAKLPWRGRIRLGGAVSLAIYMIGFSLAYKTLDAGLGALILFGVVQISMFSYGALTKSHPTVRQLSGAAIAFCGLVIALWPDQSAYGGVSGALFMVLAGLGWAAYTLLGKSEAAPLAATAANFVLCAPLMLVLALPFADHVSAIGIALALVCGAVTSGLGYALWYRVLADLQQNLAAIIQLSVPVIAILGGSLLLAEPITFEIVLSAALVISGIAVAVTKRSAPAGRS